MIPAGLTYGGLRVIPARPAPSLEGKAYRDAMRNLALARTGRYGFGGLGATRRRERACKAADVLHTGGGMAASYIPKSGGGVDYGGIVQAAGGLLQTVLDSTVCADDAVVPPSPLTPDPNSGNAQLQQALAQQNQQLMLLMAQQRQQQQAALSTPPPPPAASSGDKQVYLIAGGIAAAVVAVMLLRK